MTETRNTTDPTKVDPVDVVALGYVLSHAAAVGLPMPGMVLVVEAQRERRIRLEFDNLAHLAEWALYAEACIDTSSPDVPGGSVLENHVCDTEVLELKVRMTATTIAADVLVDEAAEARPALQLVEPLIDPDEDPDPIWEPIVEIFGDDFGCCVPGRQDEVHP